MTFIEENDAQFSIQIGTFCTHVDPVSTLLGLDAAKVAQIKTDRTNFLYVCNGVNTYNKYAQSVVGMKNRLRNGKDETNLIDIIQPVEWPSVIPTNMKEGIQPRFAEIIQDCVRSPNFTHDIGERLGIVKPVTPFVPENGKPVVTVHLSHGGRPVLGAAKGEYEGYAVYKDTGTGYKYYDKSIHHDYVDQHEALPAVGTSKVWKYKLIYLYKGVEVGAFSDEVVIVVYGNI